jgi:hypothetical protein
MASISKDPNGRKRVLFEHSDGQRKTIRLGKVSMRTARTVKAHVFASPSRSRTGSPVGAAAGVVSHVYFLNLSNICQIYC